MPLYEYVCRRCQNDFEVLSSLDDRDSQAHACPRCGGTMADRKASLIAQPIVKSAPARVDQSFDCGARGGCCGGACALDD